MAVSCIIWDNPIRNENNKPTNGKLHEQTDNLGVKDYSVLYYSIL